MPRFHPLVQEGAAPIQPPPDTWLWIPLYCALAFPQENISTRGQTEFVPDRGYFDFIPP